MALMGTPVGMDWKQWGFTVGIPLIRWPAHRMPGRRLMPMGKRFLRIRMGCLDRKR